MRATVLLAVALLAAAVWRVSALGEVAQLLPVDPPQNDFYNGFGFNPAAQKQRFRAFSAFTIATVHVLARDSLDCRSPGAPQLQIRQSTNVLRTSVIAGPDRCHQATGTLPAIPSSRKTACGCCLLLCSSIFRRLTPDHLRSAPDWKWFVWDFAAAAALPAAANYDIGFDGSDQADIAQGTGCEFACGSCRWHVLKLLSCRCVYYRRQRLLADQST